MKILAVDSSAKSVSVAISDKNKILAEYYLNTGFTHSQTLMPLIKSTLDCTKISVDEIDLFAVNKGPGSFTGIRIGVAAVKGMSDVKKKKCIGISTLESMAYNVLSFNGVACCVMDARCNQVYCALFDITDGIVTRLCDDCAISIDELKNKLKNIEKNKIFVGDGAELCYNAMDENLGNIRIAPDNCRYQKASGVCLCANAKSDYIDSSQLVPDYLRLSQAERELKRSKEV